MSELFIVGLGGTIRRGSSSESAVRVTLEEAAKFGARVRMFAGPDLEMPMYAPDSPERNERSRALVEALRACDGVIIGSPGYHGGMSGLIKNALDYTEDMRADGRVYLEERSVGCIVTAAGWQAVGTTLTSMRSVVHALRGWPTPLGVGINTIAVKAFDSEGRCIDPAVAGQLRTLAQQVIAFARAAKLAAAA